jgi:hypothetical protein
MTDPNPTEHLARYNTHKWKRVPEYDPLEDWHAAFKIINALLIISTILVFVSFFMVMVEERVGAIVLETLE